MGLDFPRIGNAPSLTFQIIASHCCFFDFSIYVKRYLQTSVQAVLFCNPNVFNCLYLFIIVLLSCLVFVIVALKKKKN